MKPARYPVPTQTLVRSPHTKAQQKADEFDRLGFTKLCVPPTREPGSKEYIFEKSVDTYLSVRVYILHLVHL